MVNVGFDSAPVELGADGVVPAMKVGFAGTTVVEKPKDGAAAVLLTLVKLWRMLKYGELSLADKNVFKYSLAQSRS